MAKAIFFSWQADTPNKVGRTFLKEVLKEVCASIVSDTTIDEALRDIAVDTDTKGVAGQPPIAETIFKKIDKAAVFVADMTFTGKRIDSRPTPNPNVLIEYGWALKSLSHERVICLMNTAYGNPSPDSLPFDLAHIRWPIPYRLLEDATTKERVEEKQKLTKKLKEAISLCLGTIPESIIVPPRFPLAQAKDGPARFREINKAVGFLDDDIFEDNKNIKEIFLTPGPAIWLRLIPPTIPEKEWKTPELKKIAMEKSHLAPLILGRGYSYFRAEDGIGAYRGEGEKFEKTNSILTSSVVIAFKTGEIWSIETAIFSRAQDKLFSTTLEEVFVKGIQRYSQFLEDLKIEPPYNWMAGLIGVRNRKLFYPPPPGKQWLDDSRGHICAPDLIEAEGQITKGQSATSALLPLFEKIFEECGVDRPEYLPQ